MLRKSTSLEAVSWRGKDPVPFQVASRWHAAILLCELEAGPEDTGSYTLREEMGTLQSDRVVTKANNESDYAIGLCAGFLQQFRSIVVPSDFNKERIWIFVYGMFGFNLQTIGRITTRMSPISSIRGSASIRQMFASMN